MVPIHTFPLMLIFQVCGYVLLDRYNLSIWKYALFGLCLFLDFFVLPRFFMPVFEEGELRCGMPSLGIFLGFWIFGGGSVIITHFVYVGVRRFNRRKV